MGLKFGVKVIDGGVRVRVSAAVLAHNRATGEDDTAVRVESDGTPVVYCRSVRADGVLMLEQSGDCAELAIIGRVELRGWTLDEPEVLDCGRRVPLFPES